MQNMNIATIDDLAVIGQEISETSLAFVSGGKGKIEKEVKVEAKCDTNKVCSAGASVSIKW